MMEEVDPLLMPLLEEVVQEEENGQQKQNNGLPNYTAGTSSSDLLLIDDIMSNNNNNNNNNTSVWNGHRKCNYCNLSIHRIQQSFFLVGSLLSTISSSLDFCDALDDDDDNDDDDITPSPPTTTTTTTAANTIYNNPFTVWDASKLFMTLATLFYLMDSLIHIMNMMWLKSGTEHEQQRMQQIDDSETVAIVTEQQLLLTESLRKPLLEDYKACHDSSTHSQEEILPPSNPINLISSQNQDWDLNVFQPPIIDDDTDSVKSISTSWTFSVLFGVAATFDLLSSMTDDDVDDDDDNDNDDDVDVYPWPSFIFGTICVILFWACAVITLWNKRTFYYDHFFASTSSSDNNNSNNSIDSTNSEWSLLLWGDVLFMVGCTIDLIVNFADNPIREASWMVIATAGLFSSLCWFVDAILYTWADADIFDTSASTTTVYSSTAATTTVPSSSTTTFYTQL
jgi:hypothetical protein